MIKSLLFAACIIVGLGLITFIDTDSETTARAGSSALEIEPAAAVGEKTLAANEITAIVRSSSEPELAFATFIQTLPASLAGQPAPGPLNIDDQGVLVADDQLKFLFEHYLSALGEEPLENIVARIHYALKAQLSGVNLDRGMALVEAYLQYRNYLGEIKNRYASSHVGSRYDLKLVAEMKQQVKAERLRFFSEADSRALFLREEQYDDYQLARAQIASDATLAPEQRQATLARIDAAAPHWIVESERQATLVSRVRAEEKIQLAQGADPEALYQSRAQVYGIEAAQRLAEVDAVNQRWQARVNGYQIELQSLMASSAGGQVDSELLQSLRAAHFQGAELVRIAALDGDNLSR